MFMYCMRFVARMDLEGTCCPIGSGHDVKEPVIVGVAHCNAPSQPCVATWEGTHTSQCKRSNGLIEQDDVGCAADTIAKDEIDVAIII